MLAPRPVRRRPRCRIECERRRGIDGFTAHRREWHHVGGGHDGRARRRRDGIAIEQTWLAHSGHVGAMRTGTHQIFTNGAKKCATGLKPITEPARMTAAMRRPPGPELAPAAGRLLDWGSAHLLRPSQEIFANAVRLLHHAGASDGAELDRNASRGP